MWMARNKSVVTCSKDMKLGIQLRLLGCEPTHKQVILIAIRSRYAETQSKVNPPPTHLIKRLDPSDQTLQSPKHATSLKPPSTRPPAPYPVPPPQYPAFCVSGMPRW